MRAKRHGGGGVFATPVVVWNVMSESMVGERLGRRKGREIGTHLYTMMGFEICPVGNLKSLSDSDQG